MKKIIIPLELLYPEEERRTLHYGARLASALGMGIVLTHNYRPIQADFAYGTSMVEGYPRHDIPEPVQERDEVIRKSLQAYQQELNRMKLAPPSVEFHILRNSYAENPAHRKGENAAGFVLLPRKTILSSSILGGEQVNTDEYEFEDIPILIHPKDSKYTPIRKILYSTNYHPYDIEVLKKLTMIFGKEDIKIEALHVTDDLDFEAKIKQSGYLQVVRTQTGNQNIDISTLVVAEGSGIGGGLQSYAIEKDADMITILLEKQNLIDRIRQPENIINLAAESNLPVMIFRE